MGLFKSMMEKQAKETNKEKPYDVFICCKENDGNATVDSVKAHEIYNKLTVEGYRVFFSKISLVSHIGENYELYINEAIMSSKIMILVGSKKEYLESVWVKDIWMKFLELTKSDYNKLLIPVRVNMESYDMPKELLSIQGLDIDDKEIYLKLIDVVSRVCK